MKIAAIILALCIPLLSVAQNYQGMSEEDMQKMMQQMQKMQSCMQNVDQAALKKLEQQSYRMEAEVRTLCAEGKRDEAQERAMLFAREMAKSPALQTMKKCGSMMEGMMPKMPLMDQADERSHRHVCD